MKFQVKMYPIRVSSILWMGFLIRLMIHFQVLKAAPISQSIEVEPSKSEWTDIRTSPIEVSSDIIEYAVMITYPAMPDRPPSRPELPQMGPDESQRSSPVELQRISPEETQRRPEGPQRGIPEATQRIPELFQRSIPEEFQKSIPAEPLLVRPAEPQISNPEEHQRSGPEKPQSTSTVEHQRRLEETQRGTPETKTKEATISVSTTTKETEPQTRAQTNNSHEKMEKMSSSTGGNIIGLVQGHPPAMGMRLLGLTVSDFFKRNKKHKASRMVNPRMATSPRTTDSEANVINKNSMYQKELTIPLARTYGRGNNPWRAIKNTLKQMDYDIWMDTRLAVLQHSRIPRIRMASNPIVQYYPDDAKIGTVCRRESPFYIAWQPLYARLIFMPRKIYMKARKYRVVDVWAWKNKFRNRCHRDLFLSTDLDTFLNCEIRRHIYLSEYNRELDKEQLVDVEE